MPSSAIRAVVLADRCSAASRRRRPSASAAWRQSRRAASISVSSRARRTPAPRSDSSSAAIASRCARQLLGRHAVLARQFVDAAQALFDRLQRRRVQVEVAAHAVEQGNGLVDLDRGGVEHGVDLAQARLVLDHALQVAAHLLQAARQRRALVAAEAGEGAFAGGDQVGGMGVAAMVVLQAGDGVGFQVLAVELAVLVFEPVDAVGDVALRRQCVAFGQQRAPACRRGPDRARARRRCGRRRRAGRAGWAWTTAPGVRAGHGSRPAGRTVH